MRRLRVALAAPALVAACYRYEYRGPECPPDPPPRDSVSVAAVAEPGLVAGRVTDGWGGGGVPGARVRLDGPAGARWADTDSAGAFRFAGVAPGAYRLAARRLGYGPRGGAVRVPPAGGVRAELALVRPPFDGCGLAAPRRVRVRRWPLGEPQARPPNEALQPTGRYA